jgi:hypothetical protein
MESVMKNEVKDCPARAVNVAIQSIACQLYVCRCPPGFAIVEHNGRFSVYDADAWEPPTETPVLPWFPPKGKIYCYVNLLGAVQDRRPVPLTEQEANTVRSLLDR